MPAWIVTVFCACGGMTTDRTSTTHDGSLNEPEPRLIDASAPNPLNEASVPDSDTGSTLCESPASDCPRHPYPNLRHCGCTTASLVSRCEFLMAKPPHDPWKFLVVVNCELTTGAYYDGGVLVAGDWELDYTTSPPILRAVGPLCDSLTRECTVCRCSIGLPLCLLAEHVFRSARARQIPASMSRNN
jgi:hypothetical protein